MAGIGVNRNEKIGAFLIGDRSPRLERDESVVLASVNDLGAEAGLQKFTQAAAHVEHEIFFFQAIGTDRPSVVASVAGIDDDFADLQTQHASERTLAAGGGLGFAHVGIGCLRLALSFGSRDLDVSSGAWRCSRLGTFIVDPAGVELSSVHFGTVQ